MHGLQLTCLLVLRALHFVAAEYDSCTALAVSPGASVDGSTMVTHNNDCSSCDTRVAYVPPRDWPEGSMRPVFGSSAPYPRYVGEDRAEIYRPTAGQKLSVPIGHVPQVRHTYGYWESNYAYMNEYGVSLGESTCGGNLVATADTAMLCITEITRLAMERARTAREAIEVVGGLCEKYGFYGEDPGLPGAGEALTIADGSETWIWHVMSGTTDGRSAVWVAQKVPDGHIAVVANGFTIREVHCWDKDNFLCSTDLKGAAQRAGLWSPAKGELDWTRDMSPNQMTYQYFPGFPPIPLYTSLRMWRVYSLAAPSLNLQPKIDPMEMPFSVPVDEKLTARQVMDFKRDHYEGTDYDLTKGVFAGPFGSPNRAELGNGELYYVHGQFARAISIPRTSFSTVGQTYPKNSKAAGFSKLWFAADTPATSVYAPFYANTTQYDRSYAIGHALKFDRSSAWWVFDFLSNWMENNWRLMSAEVYPKVQKMQDDIDSKLAQAEKTAAAQRQAGDESGALKKLGEAQKELQGTLVQTWLDFSDDLVAKYNDGYLNIADPTTGVLAAQHVGYPAFWLQMLGFDNDILPKWVGPVQDSPSLLEIVGPGPFEPKPAGDLNLAAQSNRLVLGRDLREAMVTVLVGLVALLAGWFGGRYSSRENGQKELERSLLSAA